MTEPSETLTPNNSFIPSIVSVSHFDPAIRKVTGINTHPRNAAVVVRRVSTQDPGGQHASMGDGTQEPPS